MEELRRGDTTRFRARLEKARAHILTDAQVDCIRELDEVPCGIAEELCASHKLVMAFLVVAEGEIARLSELLEAREQLVDARNQELAEAHNILGRLAETFNRFQPAR